MSTRSFLRTIITGFVSLGMLVSFSPITTNAQNLAQEARRAVLEAELAQLEAEIAEQEQILNQQKKQTGRLSSEVQKLASEISSKKQEISQKIVLIGRLSDEIDDRENTINNLNTQEDDKMGLLAASLRDLYVLQDTNSVEFIFSNQKLSDYFSDIIVLDNLKASLQDTFSDIRSLRSRNLEEREILQDRVAQNETLRQELESKKKETESREKTQKQLLSESKTVERQYEATLADIRAQAAEIRAALFELVGVAEGGIPFGEALELAKFASSKTGVDPAFLLAIATQETNIGKNIGTCNLPGTPSWREIMPGPNDNSWRDDQTTFLQITAGLGISPDSVPLSCPAPWGGWGGAMGPMQFIPATWVDFAPRVARMLGRPMANPWNPQDAFLASATYLMDLGAAGRTFETEREAACKYYSGRSCHAPKVKNMFYGNSVMEHKARIQANIDVIERADRG